MGGGSIAWLEAGWAETGWAGAGRQHIYTFDTNTRTWQFYDQYAARARATGLAAPADRRGTAVWQAWLWWDDRWNLLTAAEAAAIGSARRSSSTSRCTSTRAARPGIDVPPVTVDNVQLRPAGGGDGPLLARRRRHADRRRDGRSARAASAWTG